MLSHGRKDFGKFGTVNGLQGLATAVENVGAMLGTHRGGCQLSDQERRIRVLHGQHAVVGKHGRQAFDVQSIKQEGEHR